MNNKFIKRYFWLSVPFLCGILMYSLDIYNLVSSILFFAGGYIVLKNIFDYRNVNKNKKKIEESLVNNNYRNTYMNSNSIVGLKRVYRHERVRKRVKR